MSLTVSDIMKLPCLRDARVIAGVGGLSKVLNSISVLEFANPDPLQASFFEKNDFYGSEIVISAFASIPYDTELQCMNIRRLAAVGEVGLILYYVGLIVPSISQKLIDLANELDFVLILMPENRLDLRYSEVISEVMEAVFRDRMSSPSLVSDVLAQMARLPEHQRTLDSVLRIARDILRSSLILTDAARHTWAEATWPLSLELDISALPDPPSTVPLHLPDGRSLCRFQLETEGAATTQLYILRDGDPLSGELLAQTIDLVRLAVNLWSTRSEEVQISELVRAILQDEPLKMRRLAELFKIDVAALHSMWIVTPAGNMDELEQLRTELSPHCKTIVADLCLGCAVAFTDSPVAESPELIAQSIKDCFPGACVSHIHHLQNTTDVRRAFILNRDHSADAQRIWPEKHIFSHSELEFAAECRGSVDKGEDSVARALKPLSFLDDEELQRTLEVYLLDANGSTAVTAELLFLHKNTVKYRIGRIASLLGHDPRRDPEKFILYRACAIRRLTN